MKTVLIITCFFLCNLQQKDDKKIINDFIANIVLKDNYTQNNLERYLKISKNVLEDREKKEATLYIIDETVQDIKKELSKNNLEYKILSHAELNEGPIPPHQDYYDDLSKMYYLISGNKLVSTIIMENEKIISFFGIQKNGNKSYPWLLNKG